jgi:hypothetical protein
MSDLGAHQYSAVIGDLAPGEAGVFQHSLPTIIAQLDRLGILAPGTTLDNIQGLQLSSSNLTYSVTTVTTGIADVQITGGSLTAGDQPSALPIGPTLRSLITSTPAPHSRTVTSFPPDALLATLQVGGKWYVSLNYTLEEVTRKRDQGTFTDPAAGVQPSGDATADLAVEDVLRSVAAGDISHVLSLAPPDEIPAVRSALSGRIGSISSRLAVLRQLNLNLQRVTFADRSEADGTLVVIKSIDLTGTYHGQAFAFTNGCFTYGGVSICRSGLGQLITSRVNASAGNLVSLALNMRPDLGFMAVKEAGKWYVSPGRTLLDAIAAVLTATSTDQLNSAIQDVRQLHLHRSLPFSTGNL